MPAPPPPPPPPPPIPSSFASTGPGSTLRRPPPPPPSAKSATRAPVPPPPPPSLPPNPNSGAYSLSNLPPAPPLAPSLPDTPRMSEESSTTNPESKFPSFTMDLDPHDLADITNIQQKPSQPGKRASRNSVYRSDLPAQFRASMSTMSKRASNQERDSEKPWDKPIDYTSMTAPPAPVDDEEEDDDVFDIPNRLTIGPGAAAARLDLQRCTIRVHKQLVDQIKTNSMKPADAPQRENNRNQPEELSRCQGEVWLKSRFPMGRWKKRYGSIVDHAFFGPVLFLFKYDAKGNVALHHSMMIVLVDSQAKLGNNTTTKDSDYRCEFVLKTTKRKYTIAANHTMRRDYWLRNLESIQQNASTTIG